MGANNTEDLLDTVRYRLLFLSSNSPSSVLWASLLTFYRLGDRHREHTWAKNEREVSNGPIGQLEALTLASLGKI